MPADAPETVTVTEARVACDGAPRPRGATRPQGDGGALGHPKVYLQIGDEGFVDCPYCDKRFILSAASEAATH